MKKTFIGVFLTVALSCSLTQRTIAIPATISGTIRGIAKKEIILYKPINGLFNDDVCTPDDIIQLDEQQHFKHEIAIDSPCFIKLQLDGRPVWLLVAPGDTINMAVELEKITDKNKESWLQIEGKNQKGQAFFNHYNFDPFTKFLPVQDLFNQIPANKNQITKLLFDTIERSILPFNNMLKRKEITDSFHNLITKTIKANLLSEALKRFLRPTKIRTRFTRTEQEKIFADIFTYLNPNDKALESGNLSYTYIIDYLKYSFYKKTNRAFGDPLPDSIITVTGDSTIKVEKSYIWVLAETNKQRQENLWGAQICGIMSTFPDATAIAEDRDAFRHFFPKSTYLIYIDKFLKTLQDRNNSNNGESKAEFIDAPYTSLHALAEEKFKDQLVYIDLWATWCMPCLKEMAPNPTVDNFIRTNNVKRLYISFDEPAQQNLWRQTIHNYNLDGYHLLANEALKKDILKYIYNEATSYAIPRFIIINTDGTIINPDAPRPSDGQLLIQTLNTLLAKPLASGKDDKPAKIAPALVPVTYITSNKQNFETENLMLKSPPQKWYAYNLPYHWLP